MDKKLQISKEKLISIINEENINFLKEIENIKQRLVEKVCRENFVDVSSENFFKLFPKEYLKILRKVFEEGKAKINLKPFLLEKIKEENLLENFREKAKELEEYFVFDFLGKNLNYIINSIKNYYTGKSNSIDISSISEKIKDLYGEDSINIKLEDFLRKIYYKICSSEMREIYSKFEKAIEDNFNKVKDRQEIPPLLIFQMSLNSLNNRYPYLFENLNKEDEKELKEEFQNFKKKGLLLCWLYSFTKLYLDEGIKNENPENFLKGLDENKLNNFYEKFSMGMDLKKESETEYLKIMKKAYIFKKIIIENDYEILEIAEEFFEEDDIFLIICKEKIFEKYKLFVKEEVLPLLKKDKNSISVFRNLVFSPNFFSHNEILPFYKLKKNFLPFLEKEEIKEPFKDYEEKIISNLKDKIKNLKQNFSKIGKENFKERALRIFEEISNFILFWEDFGIMLSEFSKEFMYLSQIPEEVSEIFSRSSFNYLSALLNEANFLDFPKDAKPQITLFETLKEAKEKPRMLELSEILKEPVPYSRWEESLFEFKLSTPYRDFYNYIKNYLKTDDSLILLKIIVEVLQKDDFDLSISQSIFQDLSFLPEIKEGEIFNLLLESKNFPLYKNELKEKIFGIYSSLKNDLKKIIKEKGLYKEVLEIEYTKKEKAFLGFLNDLGTEKSIYSFYDYLKVAKFPYLKEEKGKWEEFFIPIKHYLIQIEPVNDFFSITLNISGQREGLHPFEGHQIKNYILKNESEISWALSLFQKYASFLLDLEEELFVFEYLEPKKKQKYKIKTKMIEKVISFKKENGKFKLKINFKKENLKKIWAKAWGPFYGSEKDEKETEKDLRFLLSALKNVLL